jgi:hypothetical protein
MKILKQNIFHPIFLNENISRLVQRRAGGRTPSRRAVFYKALSRRIFATN